MIKWQVEPDPLTEKAWAVFVYDGDKRNFMLVGELTKSNAELIAAVHAKAQLLANAVDLLEEAVEEDPRGYIAQNARTIIRQAKALS